MFFVYTINSGLYESPYVVLLADYPQHVACHDVAVGGGEFECVVALVLRLESHDHAAVAVAYAAHGQRFACEWR